MPSLFAISDLHVGYPANREVLAQLRPETDEDWLIVAGDVGEQAVDVERVLRFLAGRFAKVIWTPGNHDLSGAVGAVGLAKRISWRTMAPPRRRRSSRLMRS